MTRWAARLKANHARSETPGIPEKPSTSLAWGHFGDFGDFGSGTSAETEAREVARILAAAERAAPRPDLDPAEWCGEVEL